jgi:hypothetical protein
MATFSTFLNLKLPQSSDPFLLSDFVNNWTILDGSPGVYVCTNGSRPSWGASQAGRLIFMTDYKCLSYWTGTGWADARDAAPAFAAGAFLNTNIASSASVSFTLATVNTPRACSLVVMITGTYNVPADSFQGAWQRVVVDGVGATANQLGGFREQIRFNQTAGDSGLSGNCATSFQAISSVAAGSHTIGIGVDVATAPVPVTLIGAKMLAFIAVTSPSNNL